MEEKIKELVQGPIEEAGYILEKVVYEKENGANFLRFFIDKKEDYININDCVKVNDLLDPILDNLDLIDESYIVDVSSVERGCE